ncbi:MAG: His/Gly/Thr/Pro-type tRNA ligase C-terminal domain-containing protein [Gemmatimonadaceae bacterium]|nr:His/Gly/Thr/Pro-type tRNA ligase C-terminal domain-containing protein [Gemmatimonadaceae bacterium]
MVGSPTIDAPHADGGAPSLVLTLPNGATREVAPGTLARDVVATIGARLLKDAIAVSIDGEVQDLMTPVRKGGAFRVFTAKDPEALPVLRHSGAHILATAVRRLRPDAKIGFGPAIDDGFYYDFEVATPFTPDDLDAFEAEMRKVVAEAYPFVREEVDRAQALGRFADDPLKLERIADLPDGEVISTYSDGPFIDLCRGPHVPDTSYLKHFKLLSTAGAYWRGDEKRQMLQRIYATAFWKGEDLEAHLHRLEEAKKRDHRVVGRALELFFFHPSAPGAPFWTDRGTLLYNLLVDFVRERQAESFKEIRTPLLFNKSLWETSGHWGVYRDNMFLVLDKETGEHTRVRQFSQDDCHVFLREDQIGSEVAFLLDFILGYYRTFGLTASLKLATRPDERIGSDEQWDRAEAGLRDALERAGQAYTLKPGDGAFYGPKIDFDVTDSIGRAWQLGTIQLDYAAPERFGLEYVGDDNTRHRPVVIHRAVSGSMERFIAILIEHFAGAFPFWLSPEQVRVVPVASDFNAAAQTVVDRLAAAGIRASLDDRNETLNYRIRDGEVMKVPVLAVVGAREAEQGTVAVRLRGAGRKQEIVALGDFIERLTTANRERTLSLEPSVEPVVA